MRAVRPEPSPAVLPPKSGSRRLRGLPVLVYEVSRRVWGLRLRRTEQELALSSLPILPSVHYKDVGVRIASFRSSMAHPACSPVYASLCTSRYPTQNSGPSGSLFLSRGVSSTPASYRFIPAHCNGDFSPTIDLKLLNSLALTDLAKRPAEHDIAPRSTRPFHPTASWRSSEVEGSVSCTSPKIGINDMGIHRFFVETSFGCRHNGPVFGPISWVKNVGSWRFSK
jgi:hypothetical protein